MSKLIQDLKSDHKMFVTLLEGLQGAKGTEGSKKLLQAKSMLIDHMKKEDAHFYPALKKAAEKDPSLKAKLQMFAQEMDKMSADLIAFLDKYSTSSTGSIEYAKDLGRIVFHLKNRVRREEEILHPEFERISKAA